MTAARRRPSSVDAMRRGVGATSPAAAPVVADLTQETPTPQRPRPEKPVRFTLDLDRDRHRFLKGYADEIEANGASQVMRALLDELRNDPQLATRVRDRVWQTQA